MREENGVESRDSDTPSPSPSNVEDEQPFPPMQDRRLGFFHRVWLAFRDCCFRPSEFFSRLPAGANLPIVYVVTLSLIATAGKLLYLLVIERPVVFGLFSSPAGLLELVEGFALDALLNLVAIALLGLASHVILGLLGATAQPVGVTLSVAGYVIASSLVWGSLPAFLSLLGTAFAIVLGTIGLMKVHNCAAWQALLGVLLPPLLCLAGVRLIIRGFFMFLSGYGWEGEGQILRTPFLVWVVVAIAGFVVIVAFIQGFQEGRAAAGR